MRALAFIIMTRGLKGQYGRIITKLADSIWLIKIDNMNQEFPVPVEDFTVISEEEYDAHQVLKA